MWNIEYKRKLGNAYEVIEFKHKNAEYKCEIQNIKKSL